MRKSLSGIILLLAGVLILTGCKSLLPPMPAESYHYAPVKPQSSTVNLYADLDIARLEAVVNNHTDSVLYDDNSFVDNDNDNLVIKAWKNGEIKFTLQDDLLSWEIPLKVNIKKTVLMVAFNHPFGDFMEANGEIRLKFKTKISVTSDWTIQTVTTADDYEWTKKPTVKLAGFTFPVTPIASLLLKVNQNGYAQKIDKAIASSFNLRKYAEQGWLRLFEPFKFPGSYNAWLSLNPHSVSMLPVKGVNGNIRFGVAVTAEVECLLDRQPAAIQAPPLPILQPMGMPSDTFRINLLTDIPYPTIERLTYEELRDSSYTFGDRHLIFESLHVYGSNGKLTIETKVKGSIRGTMYLTGTPYFNSDDTTLRVKNLKFDLKTRNVWTKSAKWLFNGKIERTLTKAIAIPFNSDISEIEKNLSGYLNRRKLGYGFELNGKLVKINVSDISLTPESVKANMVFTGRLSIGLEEILLKK